MNDPVITLTTDFGEASPYVAAMKGVILGINPQARLLDLSHQIPAQDLQSAAYFLAAAIPYFPEQALHIVVVDPGVGSERDLLYVRVRGHQLLVPDNGCWTWLESGADRGLEVIRLAAAQFWRPECSRTFHGRDILAPVAARLSLGLNPAELGPVTQEWVRLPKPQAHCQGGRVTGEVIFVDGFGNLLTNIAEAIVSALKPPLEIRVGGKKIKRWVRHYAEGAEEEPVALFSSQNTLEIAIPNGNAGRTLGIKTGCPVIVEGTE
jgi:S-adenosylmethionine hydrolase